VDNGAEEMRVEGETRIVDRETMWTMERRSRCEWMEEQE
jgi:hypothetical protein